MTKALVTGASGFIGSHLASVLTRQGYRVMCLVRRTSRTDALEGLPVEFVYGDLRDAASLNAAVAGNDVVFHLAGAVKALRVADLSAANDLGVENVGRACARQSTPPRLVFVSSLAAAGPSPLDTPRREGDPCSPVSNYGRSKRQGELAAERMAGEAPISIVRPPIVFGEGDVNSLSLFRPIVRFGVHVVPGIAPWRVSLIHVQDLAAALIKIAEGGETLAESTNAKEAGQGYYFVADEHRPTYAELGQLIGRAAGMRRVTNVHVPHAAVWIAGAAAEVGGQLRRRANIFNLDKAREGSAGSWTCSSRKLRGQLGFRPEHTLLQRLRQTTSWYLRKGWVKRGLLVALRGRVQVDT